MVRFELRAGRLVDGARTIFIKLDGKNREPEKAWIGYVYGFKDVGYGVRFKVNIERSIPLSDVPAHHLSFREGWYLNEEVIPPDFALYPPFLYSLLKTGDWGEFENNTFRLLKLVGIHRIHRLGTRGGADSIYT
jgi:hypothetical protein